MKNTELKYINLLGHKRKKIKQVSNNETITNEKAKPEEDNLKLLLPKKPEQEFYISSTKDKNITQLDNIMNTKICQRCNSGGYVLCFNSSNSILDYLSIKNNIHLKNFHLGENFYFDSPKMICLNCLFSIAKNKTEFEKFFELNKSKMNEENDNPFHDLYGNPNLKLFNDIDPKEKEVKSLNEVNDKSKNVFKKFQNKSLKISSSLNNIQNNNNNNIFNNSNINFDFLNILNYFTLPSTKYSMPLNPNFSLLNIPNYYGNEKNLLINENIFSRFNPLYNPTFDYSNILNNSFLTKPKDLLSQNNTNLFNLSQFPLFNTNISLEKENKIENGLNVMKNIYNINGTEKLFKDNNDNMKQNNLD